MTATEPAPGAGLVAKLAEAAAGFERVPKSGRHPQGWTFATESDIAEMVRAGLAARGVVIIPHLDRHDVEQIGTTHNGHPIWRHTVDITYTVTDGEGSIAFQWRGQADDNSDKGLAKAMTAARKFALVNLFSIASGNDPEPYEPDRPQARADSSSPSERDDRPITEAQAKRLYAIARGHDLDEPLVRRIIAMKTDGRAWDPAGARGSARLITRGDYDVVVDAIEGYTAKQAAADAAMEEWERSRTREPAPSVSSSADPPSA